jgi:cell division protein FtsB
MKFPRPSSISKEYHHLITVQNVGIVIAAIIALGWAWGSVVTLQNNYQYQRQIDTNSQEVAVVKLQNSTLKYQQAYYKSDEYIELNAREKLGRSLPGEHLVLLPSSAGVHDATAEVITTTTVVESSNFSKWMNFFFDAR